jgi:hypothetical protein
MNPHGSSIVPILSALFEINPDDLFDRIFLLQCEAIKKSDMQESSEDCFRRMMYVSISLIAGAVASSAMDGKESVLAELASINETKRRFPEKAQGLRTRFLEKVEANQQYYFDRYSPLGELYGQ